MRIVKANKPIVASAVLNALRILVCVVANVLLINFLKFYCV